MLLTHYSNEEFLTYIEGRPIEGDIADELRRRFAEETDPNLEEDPESISLAYDSGHEDGYEKGEEDGREFVASEVATFIEGSPKCEELADVLEFIGRWL